MSKIGIAGLQLEAINGDNADAMESEIDAVARRFPWIDMVVLAELNAYGSDPKNAQPMPGPFEDRFSEIARRNGIWLIPGSIMEQSGPDVFNTCPVINPDGEVIAVGMYDKVVTTGANYLDTRWWVKSHWINVLAANSQNRL